MHSQIAMALWITLTTGTLALAQDGGQTRTWKDTTGHFTVEASFAGFENGQVRLKKTDATVISVPVAKLSADDQQYLKKLQEAQELKHDDGRPAGRKSIAGGGHAVAFEAPGDGFSLTAIRLHGARYGNPAPPREDFHIWVCDEKFEVLAEHLLPYRLFEHGSSQWVALRVPPTKVPAKFVVCVGFNPEATKGVFVSHDAQAAGKSSVGVPGTPFKPFEGGDWMIRATVAQKSDAEPQASESTSDDLPDNAVRLSHVDNSAEGKQSYAGTGFAVRFERPEEVGRVVAIELFCSRYGLPQPPDEDFHIYLLDADQKLIKDFPFPYAQMERGQERWYTFRIDAIEVPKTFFVGLWFNAHQTKGVYVGKDTDVHESHSYTGTPEQGYQPVEGKMDWMVRVVAAPQP
jgi:RNA polymerase sigma-70 factor (ECF subfamily)